VRVTVQYTDGQTVEPVVETDKVNQLSECSENILCALVIRVLIAVTGNNSSPINRCNWLQQFAN
jgi:hypothetical protein